MWVPLGHIYVSHETNANGLFSNTSYSGPAFEQDPIIVPLKSPQSSLKSKTFSFAHILDNHADLEKSKRTLQY